jgi:phospholipid/cholesterol/gamma-HCH transport system substrate-binding protein
MKLMIRFADQIVGALIIIAVGILVFVVFMLGSSQRWFVRDNDYVTYFNSASGLSPNMPVLYKGYTIGKVKKVSFNMEKDKMEVQFSIFKEYTNKVKKGSRVELVISPISALGGNQFVFHPGLGTEEDPIPSGNTIPSVNLPESLYLPDIDMVNVPLPDESDIMVKVNGVIDKVNSTLDTVNSAVDVIKVAIGKISGDLDIEKLMGDLIPVIANLREVSDQLKAPDSTVMSFLSKEGDLYGNLDKTLGGAAGSLMELEGTIGDIHTQTPQLAALFGRLLTTLKTVSQVLESVRNNPLLKGGVQEQPETRTGGSNARNNTEF